MDYDFIKNHRKIFMDKIETNLKIYDKREIFGAYDAALVEAMLLVSEERFKTFDKHIEMVFDALNKDKKGEGNEG